MTAADAPLRPEDALAALAVSLRDEGPVIAPHVAEPAGPTVLGVLAAAGPRCAADPGSYATVVELVREGYLCHYGEPRLLARLDPDLRLLAGDHLYARGIERLARLGDLLAVAELSDLISIAAQLDAALAPIPTPPRSPGWPPRWRSAPARAPSTPPARRPCARAGARTGSGGPRVSAPSRPVCPSICRWRPKQ